MTEDEMVRTFMTSAAVLMEEFSATLVLDPLDTDLPDRMRFMARDLERLAGIVDALRRAGGVEC